MPHHDKDPVGIFMRMLKTSLVEPGSSALGQKLGRLFLNHPSLMGTLDRIHPDWRTAMVTGVRALGGAIETQGTGPVAYVLNEGIDAFVGGIATSLKGLEGKSEEELANDLSVIAAIEQARDRIEGLANAKVKVDNRHNIFHFDGCLRAGGKPTTLEQACKAGINPAPCHCTGEVWNGFIEAMERDSKAETKPTSPFTVIELIDMIEREAAEAEDQRLLGCITHFHAEFTDLPEGLRLKFEYLAKEDRAKEKLTLLVGYDMEEWERVIDAMLDDPIQAKAEGAIKKVAGLFEKGADWLTGQAKAEGEEIHTLLGGVGSAIRRDNDALDERYDRQLERREFGRGFRADQAKRLGWFTCLSLGSLMFFITMVVYYGLTH